VVVLLSASKLPKIGRGLGQAIRNFKKSVSEAAGKDKLPKKQNPLQKENT
jgi:Sec-independent protein translocase protein TatA